MAMKNPQQLFLHELGDMYDAEQRILHMLPLMANEVENSEVKSAFNMHEQVTHQQVKNLEQCFQILGEKPPRTSCDAIAGLKKEHDSFLKEGPSPEILTMFDLGGACKTEYYEMASYRGLVEKANLMGQPQVAQLLQENLRQEEAMAQRVEQMSRKLGKQMAGMR
ncbi:MAG TPA: ferritin-like domain-containing protein [Ktedonobacteraceae bacterium]|jgi:ferritin-like metal-binding protein YciE|nr:ferritin-like domain-containing protein [Ktedonobacteraceae bacterium]